MVFFDGLNHGLNQWFKPIGLNQPTLSLLVSMIHIIYISILCVYLLPYFIIHGPVLVKDMPTPSLKRSRFHFLVQNDPELQFLSSCEGVFFVIDCWIEVCIFLMVSVFNA